MDKKRPQNEPTEGTSLLDKKSQIEKRNKLLVGACIPAGQHRLQHVDDQAVDGDNALQQLTRTLTSTKH